MAGGCPGNSRVILIDEMSLSDRAKADLMGQAKFLKDTYVSRGELHPDAAVFLDAALRRVPRRHEALHLTHQLMESFNRTTMRRDARAAPVRAGPRRRSQGRDGLAPVDADGPVRPTAQIPSTCTTGRIRQYDED
jgi:hypothetical protein